MKIYRGVFSGKSRLIMAVDRSGQKNTRRRPIFIKSGQLQYDWRETGVFVDSDELVLLKKLSRKFLTDKNNRQPVSWPKKKPKKVGNLCDFHDEIFNQINQEKQEQEAWANALMHAKIGACKFPSKQDNECAPRVPH